MIVYIDLIIFSTILVNYLFIKTITIIYKEKINIIRTIISLIISCISLLLYLLPYRTYFIIRYFIGIIIGIIAFDNNNIKNKIIKIVIFYILNMAFIGTLVVFQIKNIIPMILSVIYIILLYIIQNYKELYKKEYIYKITINNKIYKGYMDTGNNSTYNNIPIIYMRNTYKTTKFRKIDVISILTISSTNQIDIYEGEELIYKKRKYKVYYSFTDNITFDVLLNNLLGGDFK